MKQNEIDTIIGKLDEREYEEALSTLSGLIKENSADVDALNLAGFSSLFLGDIDSADDYFGRALASDPYDFVSWGERGRCAMLKGDYENAAKLLGKACALFDDPELSVKSEYQLLKAGAELELGNVESSFQSFESAQVLNGPGTPAEIAEIAKAYMNSKQDIMGKSKLRLFLRKLAKKGKE